MRGTEARGSIDQFIRPALFHRPIFYASVHAFFILVPGFALLLFGERKALILPESVIELIFPFSVFSWEKSIVAALISWLPHPERIVTTGFDLPLFK
ncbi:MAG: hypothetical protein AB1586_10740 [Pseudomonadota bacterium]